MDGGYERNGYAGYALRYPSHECGKQFDFRNFRRGSPAFQEDGSSVLPYGLPFVMHQ